MRELGMDAFKEDEHPRKKDGKFTKKGGAGKIGEMKEIPLPKDAKTGDGAHEAARFDFEKRHYDAVRHYSADEKDGQNVLINRHFRQGVNLPERCKATVSALDDMFAKYEGLKAPIRVYRGVPLDVAGEVLNKQGYSDAGFVSSSSSVKTARAYGQAVLVMDLPSGYKAISIEKLSRKPDDKEILQKRGAEFEVKAYNITDGMLYIYLGVDDGR